MTRLGFNDYHFSKPWIVLLNFCYSLHRGSYKRRNIMKSKADVRESTIDNILHPIRNKFIQ